MIADITITEKSFGAKSLYKNLRFSIGDDEKIGVIGRNGVGKSTLLGILAGTDTDFTGDIVFRRGVSIVSSRQEHHDVAHKTVLQYILEDLPEYAALSHIIETYPETMGDSSHRISEYTDALQRFSDLGYYQSEQLIVEDLKRVQISEAASHGLLSSLSGGQKRLVEVIKIMHSHAHLALIDEPTNHMDYIAKAQFVDWMKSAPEAMLIITHDRDVLRAVDRIIEIRDGEALIYNGNYDQYLRQNAMSTTGAMNEYEVVQRQIANLRDKVVQFRRLKERARDPDTIKQFKRREQQAAAELAELEKIEKPTFWIDKSSVESLGLKSGAQYQKFKAKNIRIHGAGDVEGHTRLLVDVQGLSLGYGESPLFANTSFQLREGQRIELRGRNGAGKTTLIRAILASILPLPSSSTQERTRRSLDAGPDAQSTPQNFLSDKNISGVAPLRATRNAGPKCFAGLIDVDSKVKIGVYEQEVGRELFEMTLGAAIESIYLSRKLSITDTKVRQLLGDYLFTPGDRDVPVAQLSGGQKARLQLIAMMADGPNLLILDEPTNHLDLPSIEELETTLARYRGAILYVSHDSYFQSAIGGDVVQL
ncbi:MAG: ABC-F family ATP-binding cassette domain-containing protein [Candidatus Saccharimonadales bacterium]|jgi:ATPase subunit of ABC transporter with duplicated ATPase domains